MAADAPRQPESPYAAEGTTAHSLGELKASLAFGKITGRQFAGRLKKFKEESRLSEVVFSEMEDHTDAYVDLIRERLARYPHSVLLLEQRVFTGIESCWGTSDAVIVSPRHVEIIDFKYGQGVRVEAERNPQLRLYGLGALDSFGDLLGEVEEVYITVHQPRLDHTSTEALSADELRAWREEIRPIAAEALAGSDRFGPSEEACRWCPIAGECRPRMEAATAVDFATDPNLVSPDELGELLAQIPQIKAWCADVEAYALDRVYSQGEPIPGWKVVLSGGRRSIQDPEAALQALFAIGKTRDEVVNPGKIKGIGDLEKLLGKETFETTVAPFVAKSEGQPSLVPDDDRRPSTDPNSQATKEFSA
jgi:hypothetical protein